MMRYFHLPVDPVVKVGLLAQAPVGDGGVRIYENLSIQKETVKNIRAGNREYNEMYEDFVKKYSLKV